jgi:hypothetical protein
MWGTCDGLRAEIQRGHEVVDLSQDEQSNTLEIQTKSEHHERAALFAQLHDAGIARELDGKFEALIQTITSLQGIDGGRTWVMRKSI